MITEADVKDEIKIYLTSIGAWWFMYVPVGYGRNGIPDFLICYRGWFIAVEAKRPPEGKESDPQPKPNQVRELTGVQKSEGIAIVAWTLEPVRAVIAYVDAVEGRA